MKKKYAKIVFGLPLKGPFDYLIPEVLWNKVELGKRVEVSFRERKRVGYCVGISEKTEVSFAKEIISVLDDVPLFSKRFLLFLKKLCQTYFCSWGEMIETALPAYLRYGTKLKAELLKQPKINIQERDFSLPHKFQEVIRAIEKQEQKNFVIFDDYVHRHRTAVFLELSQVCLKAGRDVLLILPEVSRVEEMAQVFKDSFSKQVIIYHSGLKDKEALQNWYLMYETFPKILIGSRLAIYHPKESFGLIIVDDEGSSFHKQEESPFYNARDVALMRAKFFKTPLVLAGPPVSVQTFYKIEKQNFYLIDLREIRRDFPQVHWIDLSALQKKTYLSKPLELKITQALNEQKKVILFLNRRGFSTYIKCIKCGRFIKCERCARNLTYHFTIKKLVCHSCGSQQEVFSQCPYCNCLYLRYRGMGTEKLESELSRIFPQAKISRLDLDVTKYTKKVESILNDFQENRTNILIGTSLILKGFSLGRVGLLGIINLEQGIDLHDFRGSERLFWLLLSMLRLLYSENGWAEMLIQTYNPDSYPLKALRQLDYDSFYREEISARRELRLPPFGNLIILNLRGKRKRGVEKNAHQLSHELKNLNRNKNIFISEAIPHPLYKLRDKFRWQIFIKSKSIRSVYKMLSLIQVAQRRYKGNILTVDVEPC